MAKKKPEPADAAQAVDEFSKLDASATAESRPVGVFENYEIVEINRSEIHPHPKNPRVITAKARDRLKKGLDKFGLLEPLIVSKRTKHLLGGHQRLSIIDAKQKGKSYPIRVAMVDLDEKAELEAMVFLNNSQTQGDWDPVMLEELYRVDKIGIEESGFSVADLYQMFGDSPLADRPDDLMEMANKLRESQEVIDDITDTGEEDLVHQTEFYAVVVFESESERAQFCSTLLVEDNRYVDGRELWTLLHSSSAVEMDLQKGCFRTTIHNCARCGKTHLQAVVWPLANPTDEFDHWAFCVPTCQPVLISRKALADSEVEMVPDSELPETEEEAAVAAVSGSATKGRTDSGREIENT